ncbi:MAG: hypothetical protein Q4G27_04980 [Flavobacteriaceae bacterium]|nr:hypothetical protein [Flavobacteriaceae bacterium]
MNFESKKVQMPIPQQAAYEYLSDLNNYQNLMPDNAEFSVHESGNGFFVQLKGMPKVGLKLKETQAPDFILFESPNDAFNYEMKVIISAVDDNASEAFIQFDGKFNPMVEMMAKKPLTTFIETIADKLEKQNFA